MKASGAAALNVLPSPVLYGNRQIIFQRATEMRLPAIYQSPEEAEEGGFMAYGPRLVRTFRELIAPQIVKLLRGTKPADIPVEQPTKFELVINLKTATSAWAHNSRIISGTRRPGDRITNSRCLFFWPVPTVRSGASIRPQLGVTRTCHRHRECDAIDPSHHFASVN